MKAIILSRVSTIGQDNTQQTDEVLKECHKDGYSDDDIILIEQKESAVKLDEEHRLSLHELKATILKNEGQIGCVYVYEISRIGRRSEVNYSIRNFLQEHHVQLVVLKPYIKLFDENFHIVESANMIFAIFNALAENEGYLRKERTMRGQRKAQSEGKAVTGRVPFGYCVEPKTHMILVDEEKAEIVRKLYDMYANQDYSTVMLARYFHETGEIPSRVTVGSMCRRIGKMLTNPAYIGKFPKSSRSDGKLVRNIYPPIMTNELYDKVQAKKLANFRSQKKSTKHIYYCKGILLDEITQQKFVPRVVSGSYFFIYDDFNSRRQISIPINLLDSIVWHITKEYRLNNLPISTKEIINTAKNKRSVLLKKANTTKKRIADYKSQILKINERIVSGRLREVVGDAMLDRVDAAISQLEEEFIVTMLEIHHYDEVITRYSNEVVTSASLDRITDDKERMIIIQKCIKSIEASKKADLKAGTTDITINFENGTIFMYRINSYTRECFDLLTAEKLDYEYMDRIDYYKYHRKKSNNIEQ